jgi:hypothetical protein
MKWSDLTNILRIVGAMYSGGKIMGTLFEKAIELWLSPIVFEQCLPRPEHPKMELSLDTYGCGRADDAQIQVFINPKEKSRNHHCKLPGFSVGRLAGTIEALALEHPT